MCMKSQHLNEIKLEQLEITEFSFYEKDTQRRKIYKSAIQWKKWWVCKRCKKEKSGRWEMCRECYFEMRKATLLLKCDFCQAEVEKKISDMKRSLQNWCKVAFCSKTCSMSFRNLSVRLRCQNCEWYRRRTSIFCSDECRNETLHKKRASKMIDCLECWKKIYPLSAKTKFCSMQCKNENHSKTMQAEWNSNYKHWLALDNYPREFYQMRKQVLERDWWVCIICWTSDWLVIHHRDRNPRNNDINNLVTVCWHHHAIHHHSTQTPYPQLN